MIAGDGVILLDIAVNIDDLYLYHKSGDPQIMDDLPDCVMISYKPGAGLFNSTADLRKLQKRSF